MKKQWMFLTALCALLIFVLWPVMAAEIGDTPQEIIDDDDPDNDTAIYGLNLISRASDSELSAGHRALWVQAQKTETGNGECTGGSFSSRLHNGYASYDASNQLTGANIGASIGFTNGSFSGEGREYAGNVSRILGVESWAKLRYHIDPDNWGEVKARVGSMGGGLFGSALDSLMGSAHLSDDGDVQAIDSAYGVEGKVYFDSPFSSPDPKATGGTVDVAYGGKFYAGIGNVYIYDGDGEAIMKKAYGVYSLVKVVDDSENSEIGDAYGVYSWVTDPGSTTNITGDKYSFYGIGDVLFGKDSDDDGKIDNVAADVTLFVDTANGEVGIGTSSPAEALHVNGAIQLHSGSANGLKIYNRHGTASTNAGVAICSSGSHDSLIFGDFSDKFGDLRLYAGGTEVIRGFDGGKVAIGTTTVGEELTVEGAVQLNDMGTRPGAPTNAASLYSYAGKLFAADADGDDSAVSPHSFELYQPAADDPLPWTYYSRNAFIGKKINVDMSGAIRALEDITGQQFIYMADLPAEERLDFATWKKEEEARLLQEARQAFIAANPLVEVLLDDALEEVEVLEAVRAERTVIKHQLNLATRTVEAYNATVVEETLRPTGEFESRLKADVRFNEDDGKFYRSRTLADVDDGALNALAVDVSQWVKDRLPR